MIKKGIFLILLIQFFWLQSLQIDIQLQEPKIENEVFSNDLPVNLNPGEPKIAYKPLKILLPMGMEMKDIHISWAESKQKNNISLDFAKQQIPISSKTMMKTDRNETIYSSNAFFPKKEMEILGTQRYRGYNVLLINLYPYSYNPVEKILTWNSSAVIDIELVNSPELQQEQNKMLVNSPTTEKFLEKIVINPEQGRSYSKSAVNFSRNLPDSNDPYQMLIITDEQSEPYFTDFIAWKEEQGIPTGLFLTSAIYEAYAGEDNPAKIRNFIADAFAVYAGTDVPLEYVLLGGDDSIVPIRGAYGQVGSYVDYSIPTDLYYSCLDGEWDANGNGIYGEYEDLSSIDLIPEIAVGRIAAKTENEFYQLFNKTYHYVDTTTSSQDVAYMVGENLNWDPLTWGAWYKEEVRPLVEDNSDFKVFSLYQMEGTYSSVTVKDAIDNGLAIINHMGHSNENVVFGQNGSLANSYTNSEYGFAYSQGCYPAAFDNATSGPGHCIAANLTNAEKGLYAFVGNTRYGWYSPGDTNGASQFYDLTFFEALFEENIRSLGEALQYSRVELLNEALTIDVMRWVYYEMVVFGDPSVEVKEPTNAFPYLEPVSLQFDDVAGDGDGVINPGEEVHIYPTIQNLPDWAEAQNVYCIADFPDDFIVLQDSVFVGNITENSEVTAVNYFHVSIPNAYNDYDFQITIYSEIEEEVLYEKTYSLSIPVSLYQANWPLDSSISLRSNPLLIPSADYPQDILSTDVNGNFHHYNYQGNLLFETNEYEDFIKMSPALADINQDGIDDIISVSRNGNIRAIDLNGDEIFSYESESDFIFSPVVADITGNGEWEIIAHSTDQKIYALDKNGELLPNFPYLLEQISYGELAAADITGDGISEIIAATLTGTLFVIDGNGENCSGFPLALGEMIQSSPTVLDNGTIVIGSSSNHLFFISPQAEIISSIPISGSIANSVIAADFTNDGELEIAFVTILGDLYIMQQDGSVLDGWPISLSTQFTYPPLAADLDNDDNLELIAVSNLNKIFAFQANGEIVAGTPIPINLPNNTPISLGDMDGDGDYDLLGSSETMIYAIDFKTAKGTKLPWRTYRGNYRRTGNYQDNVLTDFQESVVIAPSFQLFANYPNPFNPITNIRFSLPDKANVKLSVFNIKGQKVKTLLNSEMTSGEHVVRWDGKDNAQRSVASGVYLYRLQTASQEIIRKCLLLK